MRSVGERKAAPKGTRRERRREHLRAEQPATPPSRSVLPALLLVFLVALAFRLWAVAGLRGLPLWRTPLLDSAEYLLWAGQLASGDFTWPLYAGHAPGYPFLLAGLLALSGSSLTFVRIVQAILGAACCVLTARLAGRTLGRESILPAGLLQAAYGPLVLYDAAILAEGSFLLALVAALNLAVSRLSDTRRALATGAMIGVAALMRPTALILWPAVAGVEIARRGPVAWRAVAVSALALSLMILPAVGASWRTGGMAMLQGFGGMNFYLGNSPSGTGLATARAGGGWDDLEGEAGRAGVVDPAEADRYYVAKTFAEIGRAPWRYARLLASKAAWLTQAEEVRDTHSFHFFAATFPPLQWLPGFGVLLALAVMGGIEAARRRVLRAELFVYLAAFAVSCMLLVVGSRYRLPLVPALAALAGAGLAWILALTREGQRRRALVLLGIAAAAWLASHARTHHASHEFSEEWAYTAQALNREGDAAGAEAASRRAIELAPRSSFVWQTLGAIQLARGQDVAAVTSLRMAVAHNARNAHAWLYLGLGLEKTGRRPDAIEAYRQSLAVAPERTDVQEALGQALLASGVLPEALSLLRKVAARVPDKGTVRAGLALVAIAEGRAADALAEARVAADLMPAASRAWLLLGRAAVMNADFDLAVRAIDRAERAGARQGQVTAGRIKLLLLRGRRDEADRWLNELALKDPEMARAVWSDLQGWPSPR